MSETLREYINTPEGQLEDVLGNKLQIMTMVLGQFRNTHRLTLKRCNMLIESAVAIMVAVAGYVARKCSDDEFTREHLS